MHQHFWATVCVPCYRSKGSSGNHHWFLALGCSVQALRSLGSRTVMVHSFTCLHGIPSIYLSIPPPIHLLTTHPSIHQPIYLPSIHPPTDLPIYLPSIHLPTHPFIYHPSSHPPKHLSTIHPSAYVSAKSLHSCLILCSPVDHSLPGSSAMGFSAKEY